MPQRAKSTRSEDAYRSLKEDIRSNRLPPGYQAPEPELALRLGVSRTTVREALIRLEGEGLIEMIPRRGMRVLPIRAEDMAEIYEILTALEVDAAAALAQRRPSEDTLRPLSDAIKAMKAAIAQRALQDWAEADDRFHTELLKLHGNKRMLGFVSALNDQAHRVRMATLRLRDFPERSTEDHQMILDALLAGDADGARSLFRAHRARSGEELLNLLHKIPQL